MSSSTPANSSAPRIADPSTGSRTVTVQNTGSRADDDAVANQRSGRGEVEAAGVLRLRATAGAERRVVWTDETVDNEGMGKKKSKICCIYHKPKAFDESSDESSASSSNGEESDASSDSSASSANSTASGVNASRALREKRAEAMRASNVNRKGKQRHSAEHTDHEGCSHGPRQKPSSKKPGRNRGGRTVVITEPVETQREHQPSDGEHHPPLPNAYERGTS